MTAPLIDLHTLAARAEVPVERLRHYAEAGQLPAERREGTRFGYPATEAETIRLLAAADDLGLGVGALTTLANAWRTGDCGSAQTRLAEAVQTRIDMLQDDLGQRYRPAAAAPPGSDRWAAATRAGLPAFTDVARLQAVAAALADAPHAGLCTASCGCAAALAAPGAVYRFPTRPATTSRR